MDLKKVEVLGSINSGDWNVGKILNIPEDVSIEQAEHWLKTGKVRDLGKYLAKEAELGDVIKTKDFEIKALKEEVEKLQRAVVSGEESPKVERPTPSIVVTGDDENLCGCGCGEKVLKGNKYIRGHHLRKK